MRFVTTNDDNDDDDDCQAQQHEEALPLFICAPKKKKGDDDFDSSSSDIQQSPVKLMKTNGESKHSTTTACSEIKKNKLVVLIPTFTYVMYGNHNRPDFGTYYQTVTALCIIFVSELNKFTFFYLS